jgi:hypothetical protein
MTLGTLKLRLLKQFPGLDLDVLDGFIADRHSEILQELLWSRRDAAGIIMTVAPYATGTVAVVQGSAAVALTGGTWVAGMTGRQFRVDGQAEAYTFTRTGAATGTLDRPYEGDSAAAGTYNIFRSVYTLPADCRVVEDDAFSTYALTRLSRPALNAAAPGRPAYGTPQIWASYLDDASTPPNMQVELYPIPDAAIGIPFVYTAEASVPGSSSTAFAAWMEPSTALVEGVTGKILRTPQFKDLAGAQLAMVESKNALATMRNNEAQRLPHTQMELSSYYTAHRRRRW